MTAEEAAFRCRAAIEKTEEISKQLQNECLKKISRVSISLMKSILESLPKSMLQNIPSLSQQCIQHSEHILWLKNNIAPEIKANPSENKEYSEVNESSSCEKKTSKDPCKKKQKKADTVTVDSKILKKILKNKSTKENSSL